MRLAQQTVILLALVCQYTYAQPPRPIDRTEDRTQILAEIEAISKGYVGRDPAPFERVYVENYVSIRERPIYNLRDQLVAMMKADSIILGAGKKLDYETLIYETENPALRFFGRAAIVTSKKRNYWQYRGQKCLTKTTATELWIKPEAEWRQAAAHVTTFQCDAKPFHPIHPAVALLPIRGKPTANTDRETELAIRRIVDEIGRSKTSAEEPFDLVVKKHLAKDFVSTNLEGEFGRDASFIASIPGPGSARQPGFRTQDEVILVYPAAAIYTFRVRGSSASSPKGAPVQVSVFFAKYEGRWQIVATHASRSLSE